jgi:transcriptional regulator with XRE-family HTH domain
MSPRRPGPADLAMGRVIRDARDRRGLTQGSVAARLRLSAQQLQKYESGVNRVTIGRLFDLAVIFGTTPQDLVTEVERNILPQGSPAGSSPIPHGGLPGPPAQSDVLSRLDDPELASALRALFEALAKSPNGRSGTTTKRA